jgi:hypothetical protein
VQQPQVPAQIKVGSQTLHHQVTHPDSLSTMFGVLYTVRCTFQKVSLFVPLREYLLFIAFLFLVCFVFNLFYFIFSFCRSDAAAVFCPDDGFEPKRRMKIT